MSAENLDDRQKSKTNPNLKSSIVHKPFATGTVNFFHPHRSKSDNSNEFNNQSNSSKLFLNAELEEQNDLPSEVGSEPKSELPKIEHHRRSWLKVILNPWSISAIAIIFLSNLLSGAVIWRNNRVTAISNAAPPKPLTALGSANLAQGEFIPLNLNTLSRLKTAEDLTEESALISPPISPALAPINEALALSASDSEYHYVLTEYAGEQSLALARQKVAQVSLVNFPQGVFIYLGAFRDRDRAQEFVSQLSQEGFSAQIYPFD